MVGMPQWIAKPPQGGPQSPVDWQVVKDCTDVIKNNSDIVTGVFVFNEPCVHGLCFDGGGKDLLDILGYYNEALKDTNMSVNVPFSSSCIFPMTPNKIYFFQTVVRLLQKTKSPITINLYPYLDYAFKPFNIHINHALGSEGLHGPLTEWSQIDMDIARVHKDMARLGPEFKDTPIQIGESGWSHAYGNYPQSWEEDAARKQDVYKVTTPEYANRFYMNLVQRLHSLGLAGIYIFELGSESWKPAIFPAYDGEKHFGISGLYDNSSKAPWHIDNPSEHPPWTGFATMRPEDWKEFDDEQAKLKARVKSNPQDLLAVEQLKIDAPAAEKLKGQTVKQQLKADELRGKNALRAKALDCTPAHHDTYNEFGNKIPCCKDLVVQSVKCRGTDVCEFCMPSNRTSNKTSNATLSHVVQEWQQVQIGVAANLSWAPCAAGALAAATLLVCAIGYVAFLRRASYSSLIPAASDEIQGPLEEAILE